MTAKLPTVKGDHVRATYLLRCGGAPEKVAEIIAGEQSSGTFVPVPGESPELKARSAARIEALQPVDDNGCPALPGAVGAEVASFRMTLSWPLANIGPSLPNFVATVTGNLFELREVAGPKLLEIEVPLFFHERYPGSAFGVEGTRRRAAVKDRPLIGTIVKPSVSLGRSEKTRATICGMRWGRR